MRQFRRGPGLSALQRVGFRSGNVAMNHPLTTNQPLDRYIDRFLFADGWRVTNIVTSSAPVMYDVTITKTAEPGMGQSATRRATSAGEATFKACSVAREMTSPVVTA
jgi:hypothetical protein